MCTVAQGFYFLVSSSEAPWRGLHVWSASEKQPSFFTRQCITLYTSLNGPQSAHNFLSWWECLTCSFFCGLLHSFGSAQKERSLVLYRVFVHDQVEHFLFFLLLSLSIYWHLFLLFLREASSHNQSAIFQPSKKVKRGEGKKHSTAFFFLPAFHKASGGVCIFFRGLHIYIRYI